MTILGDTPSFFFVYPNALVEIKTFYGCHCPENLVRSDMYQNKRVDILAMHTLVSTVVLLFTQHGVPYPSVV